jgi:hypothetical protein
MEKDRTDAVRWFQQHLVLRLTPAATVELRAGIDRGQRQDIRGLRAIAARVEEILHGGPPWSLSVTRRSAASW